MSFFAKAIMPIATSFFRKVIPAGLGGVRSFFSKAPSLKSISSSLGQVSKIGNQIVDSPVADALASKFGGGKSLALARQGLTAVDKVQKVTNEASNILEKVKATQPMKQQQAVMMSPKMPDIFGGNVPVIGGRAPVEVGKGYEGFR